MLDLAAFRKAYGGNERRTHLIDILVSELAAITARGWTYRAYVFGSFVKVPLKDVPGDIDVLLSISQPFGADRWYQLGPADIHIKHVAMQADFASPKTLKPGKTVRQMIELFNEACRQTNEDVRIDGDGSDLVEVI